MSRKLSAREEATRGLSRFSRSEKGIVPLRAPEIVPERVLSRRRFVRRTGAATVGLAAGWGTPTILPAASTQWGDLVGRLVYDGPAPERKRLKVDKDLECCGKFDIRDESLMVGEDGGLANVFLYLRTRAVDVCPELEETVEKQVKLDNRDCIFMPHCMTIWYDKQEFYIINSDPVPQNVDFAPLGDLHANIVLPVDGDATWTFKRAQRMPVPIACNYHPWESAYILPFANPYVAISGPDGTFKIPKLPVGQLEFQVWHERHQQLGYLPVPQWFRGRFRVTIKPGTNYLPTFKLAPSLFERK